MRVLVTGGNGFIGMHCVDALHAAGWQVRVLDLFERRFGTLPAGVEYIKGDLSNDYTLREALVGVDQVLHLAWASIHEVATRDPLTDIATNLMPSVRLINEAHLAGVQRFVFLSSGGTVYGPAQYLPIDEAHPTNPISAYGITKLTVEKYLQLFYTLHGLDYIILRPSVPYGPGQDPRRRQGAVNVFLYRLAESQPIEIWGDGSVVRDYFFISDLTTAVQMALSITPIHSRVFNLGGGKGYTIKELLNILQEVTGKNVAIHYLPKRQFDVPNLVLDTAQAKTHLTWAPQLMLEEGVAQTWEWVKHILGR